MGAGHWLDMVGGYQMEEGNHLDIHQQEDKEVVEVGMHLEDTGSVPAWTVAEDIAAENAVEDNQWEMSVLGMLVEPSNALL